MINLVNDDDEVMREGGGGAQLRPLLQFAFLIQITTLPHYINLNDNNMFVFFMKQKLFSLEHIAPMSVRRVANLICCMCTK